MRMCDLHSSKEEASGFEAIRLFLLWEWCFSLCSKMKMTNQCHVNVNSNVLHVFSVLVSFLCSTCPHVQKIIVQAPLQNQFHSLFVIVGTFMNADQKVSQATTISETTGASFLM